jgi:hypothetical protein
VAIAPLRSGLGCGAPVPSPDRAVVVVTAGLTGMAPRWTREGIRARLFEAQGGRCAICGKHDSVIGSLCLDHDHACDECADGCPECIRGLLCRDCNWGLGWFRDNPESLRVAAQYVEERPG